MFHFTPRSNMSNSVNLLYLTFMLLSSEENQRYWRQQFTSGATVKGCVDSVRKSYPWQCDGKTCCISRSVTSWRCPCVNPDAIPERRGKVSDITHPKSATPDIFKRNLSANLVFQLQCSWFTNNTTIYY